MNKTFALIIEPNRQMAKPYAYLPDSYDITRVTNLETAFEQLIDYTPDIVFLSLSYSTHKLLDFLSELKMNCKNKLIPLVFVVDLDHRLNLVPGTYWGGKLAILHSLSDFREVMSSIKRINPPPRTQ